MNRKITRRPRFSLRTLRLQLRRTQQQRICERLAELVDQARREYPDVADRQDEPGFRGSLDERHAIAAFIDQIEPELTHSFVQWCRKRTKLANASPAGLDLPRLVPAY